MNGYTSKTFNDMFRTSEYRIVQELSAAYRKFFLVSTSFGYEKVCSCECVCVPELKVNTLDISNTVYYIVNSLENFFE